MTRNTINFEERIARYAAWRRLEPVDRPMIGILWEPDIPPLPEFMSRIAKEEAVLPEHIRPKEFLPHIEHCYERTSRLLQDGLQRFTPAFGIPWMEAIVGCPVVANPGSLWAEPCLQRLKDRPPIRFDPENPWFRKLVEFVRVLVEHAQDRFPVATPQFRGPLDMLAAMRTPQGMCMDLVDHPEEVEIVLNELADLWIAVGHAVVDEIPAFRGGYMGRMGSRLPDKAITMQNDVSTLVSPEHYKQFVLPLDEKITDSFPCTEFHAHASASHQIDNLLRLPNLDTIELTLEHTLGGPSLDKMLPVVRRILSSKPVVLAALDLETADRCLTELPHEGLFLAVALNDYKIPSDIVRWLEARIEPDVQPADS